MSSEQPQPSVPAPPPAGTATNGIACVAFSTESPHGSRGDAPLSDLARELRRGGYPSRVFHVHLHPSDGAENDRRIQRLVERLIGEGCRWAVFHEIWTAELGRQLHAAGIGLIEMRSHTFPEAIFCDGPGLTDHIRACATGQPLDELPNLVEIVGPRDTRPVTAIDLRLRQACGYSRSLADNPFYRDVLDDPGVSAHRGCAHCMNAIAGSRATPAQVAEQIVERLRNDRRVFPALETFWMPFAETFYDSLAIALRSTREDELWRGITLVMQCRPDVIAQRAGEIEALAAEADGCGTRLKIGVVGFENFSPPEILVLNRGATPDELDAAATILNRWSSAPPAGLLVRGYTPSFILFTPWTRLDDLRLNLERIARHGLWNANLERLRIGPGTPAFEKARREGLVEPGPVRAASHPNGYTSEREIRFVDPAVAEVSAGFERLRALAHSDQPELLAAVIAAVEAPSRPASIDWDRVAQAWDELGGAPRAA